MPKKETELSVLKEIRDLLKEQLKPEVSGVQEAKNNELIIEPKSIADLVKAGNYDYANSDITDNHFERSTVKKTVVYKLFHFDRVITSEDAIKEMEKEGYQPAKAYELLSLGEKQPELQRKFPIIALGSVWVDPNGHRYVVYLISHGSKREAHLDAFDYKWYGPCRFLAVAKSS